MTQGERVIQYIRDHGSISPMEAFHDLGITKLATRISELSRKQGYVFKRQYMEGTNRFGKAVYYMRYSMPEEAGKGQGDSP